MNSTRIARPNNNYPNKRPNGNGIFGQNSGNSLDPHSGSKNKFGHDSGNNIEFVHNSGIIFGIN
jgi:hypothetical protein